MQLVFYLTAQSDYPIIWTRRWIWNYLVFLVSCRMVMLVCTWRRKEEKSPNYAEKSNWVSLYVPLSHPSVPNWSGRRQWLMLGWLFARPTQKVWEREGRWRGVPCRPYCCWLFPFPLLLSPYRTSLSVTICRSSEARGGAKKRNFETL